MADPIYSDTGCTGSAPLVLGAARGIRTFFLDGDGWFRGVTYRDAWRDGENVAKCFVTRRLHPLVTTTRAILGAGPPPYTMGGVVFDADPDVPPKPEAGHEFAGCKGLEPTCGCGFYAYHESEQRYAAHGPGCRVAAVVEAYGKVVLGTTGFRAEKARILGVAVPPVTEASARRAEMDRVVSDLRDAIAELNYQAGRRWWRKPVVVVYAALAVAIAGASVAVTGGWPGLLVAGFCAANARISYVVGMNRTSVITATLAGDLKEAIAARRLMPEDFTVHVERARARYPGVRFFESEKELREAFPVESMRELAMAWRREEGREDD